MSYIASLASAALTPSTIWALQGAGQTGVAYRVLVGLVILAAVEIAAGLWLVHVGERQHHGR